MRRMTVVLAALVAGAGLLVLPHPAAAESDAFENGFKRELGAIGARTAVGFGVGLFNAAGGGGAAGYDGQYVYPNYGYTYYGGGHPGYYPGGRHHQPYYPRHHYRSRYDYRPRHYDRGHGYGHYKHKPKHRKHVEYHHHDHYYGSCGSSYSRYEYHRRY